MNNIKINKSKKIILILLLIILINPVKIYGINAKTCDELRKKSDVDKTAVYTDYYKGRTVIYYKTTGSDPFYIFKGAYAGMNSEKTTEPLINRNSKCEKDTERGLIYKDNGETKISVACMNEAPEYIVFRNKAKVVGSSDGIFGFEDLDSAKEFYNASNEIEKMTAWLLQKNTMSDICPEISSDDPGIGEMFDTEEDIKCNSILSARTMMDIKKVLNIIRVIVPVLVIVYGSIDLAKAAMAQKEDNMKKAQNTFMKRMIVGVAFFFIPTLINIIINTVNDGNILRDGLVICKWDDYAGD